MRISEAESGAYLEQRESENFLDNPPEGGGGGGGGAPYNGLYGEAPPETGTFFRVQVYKRVGISQVEVCKRVGKSVV